MKIYILLLLVIYCRSLVFGYDRYKFQAGDVSNSKLRKLSQEPMIKKTILSNQLKWLANHAKFHTFYGANNLKLQAMYIENIYADKTPIIFCPGFAEPMAKYTKFIRYWYDLGHSVYTFDLRGQGFSDIMEYDEGSVVHLNSFQDYVMDLKIFVDRIEKRLTQIDSHYTQKYSYNNNDSGDTNDKKKHHEIIYIGLSLSGLIGTVYQSQVSSTTSTSLSSLGASIPFQSLVLLAPCIAPLGKNIYMKIAVALIRLVGRGNKAIVRFKQLPLRNETSMELTPYNIKNSDDVYDDDNEILNGPTTTETDIPSPTSHDVPNLDAWFAMRDVLQVWITGPSANWAWYVAYAGEHLLNELMKNNNQASENMKKTNIMVVQVGVETFVDNAAMNSFFNILSNNHKNNNNTCN